MTLLELFAAYERKRLRGKSDNTVRLYHHTIRAFGAFVKHTPTIADFDSDLIEDHLFAIIKRGGSPATANKHRSQLIALWKFAAERRIVEQFPQVQAIKEPEQTPLGWLPEELKALIQAAKLEPSPVGDVPGNVWFTAMLHVLIDTAERIGALRALGRESVQGGYLLVPASVRKGKTRDRIYPLSEESQVALKKLLASHDSPTLFHWPYSHTYFYRRYDTILRRAGLPTDRKSKAHRVRKTVASAVARAGGDPTAALDHASPKTTKKYLDPRIVGGVEVSTILAAYLRGDVQREARNSKKKDVG
jgi:integrase